MDWEGQTSWARSPVSMWGERGWLIHGDLALEARVDFLAVAEHWLIPARVRSEWARLKSKGVASI